MLPNLMALLCVLACLPLVKTMKLEDDDGSPAALPATLPEMMTVLDNNKNSFNVLNPIFHTPNSCVCP